MFYCPGCKEPHQLNNTWTITGTDEFPTISPSVLVQGYGISGQVVSCHSFIRQGYIDFLMDCAHDLVGKTVMLPSWDSQFEEAV
jgi:hypothetical protein